MLVLCLTLDISDIKIDSTEELDEGPPPGWEMVLSHKMQPPSTVSSSEFFILSQSILHYIRNVKQLCSIFPILATPHSE